MIAILETIYLRANQRLLLNRNISVRKQYLEPFNCVQMKVECWKGLLLLNRNIRNHFTVGKND